MLSHMVLASFEPSKKDEKRRKKQQKSMAFLIDFLIDQTTVLEMIKKVIQDTIGRGCGG